MSKKARPSVLKREREQKKREREARKAKKTALKRARREFATRLVPEAGRPDAWRQWMVISANLSASPQIFRAVLTQFVQLRGRIGGGAGASGDSRQEAWVHFAGFSLQKEPISVARTAASC